MTNITSVTVTFGHGIKREEYGPVKKAEVSITAAVAEEEDGSVILHQIGRLALDKVADLLMAPKPDTSAAATTEAPASGEAPPARRTRGPNKAKGESAPEGAPSAEQAPASETAATDTSPAPAQDDEWAAGSEDIEVTDAELLSATSKRAGELGARDPIVKLIATFATRTEGAPFKVQEIPQAQRKDYLAKLAALTA